MKIKTKEISIFQNKFWNIEKWRNEIIEINLFNRNINKLKEWDKLYFIEVNIFKWSNKIMKLHKIYNLKWWNYIIFDFRNYKEIIWIKIENWIIKKIRKEKYKQSLKLLDISYYKSILRDKLEF